MLAAIEDLLDSFPGTLLVVSHDRYLIERVTDQQYAVMDGRLRHLPRGVDQYLELRARSRSERRSFLTGAAAPPPTAVPAVGGARLQETSRKPTLSGAELRNAQKELAAAGRKLDKLGHQVAELHIRIAEHDQSDYVALAGMSAQLDELHDTTAKVENRWLELSELLGE
ncbi:MAG: hypothetical protein J0H56_12115 [Micrococcales bacterium]|nr:hypothetical protein [Micrococcales bacterium]